MTIVLSWDRDSRKYDAEAAGDFEYKIPLSVGKTGYVDCVFYDTTPEYLTSRLKAMLAP